jgi:hypothetical protein
VIERMHREHLAHVAALHDRLEEIHGHLATARSQLDESLKRGVDSASS